MRKARRASTYPSRYSSPFPSRTGEPVIGGVLGGSGREPQRDPARFLPRLCKLIPNLSSEARLVSDIALIVTAVGVLGVVFGLRQGYRERLRQFEEKYVERYWKILDELSLEAVRGPFSDEVGRSDEKAVRSYIRRNWIGVASG